MQMKEYLRTTYAYITETGECIELDGITKISLCVDTEQSDIADIPNISDGLEFTCSFQLQPKTKMHILGVTNNSIRLHGGRPIRKIPKKFL